MKNLAPLEVTGLRSLTETYFNIVGKGGGIIVPSGDAHDLKALKRKLETSGILAGRTIDPGQLDHNLGSVTSFVEAPIADHGGFNAAGYVLGEAVIVPTGYPPAFAPYTAVTRTGGSLGTLKTWRRDIASSITNEPIVTLALAAALAAFTIDFMQPARAPIIEITGGPATGKTTALMMAASVVGAPSVSIVPFGKLLEDPAGLVKAHAGRLLCLGDYESALAGEGAKSFRLVRDAILTASEGVRLPSGGLARPVTIFESREPLAEWAGKESEIGAMLAERITTLSLDTRRNGVFDQLPEDYSSFSAYADALRGRALTNYGTAGTRFIQAFIDERLTDEPALRAGMAEAMNAFRDRCDFDPNVGAEVRDVDIFALFYAALRLTRKYGVLPRSGKMGPNILACYKLHRSTKTVTHFGRDALEALRDHPDGLDLDEHEEPDPDDVRASGLLVKRERNCTILLVRVSAVEQFIPRWRGKVVPPDLDPFLIRANDRIAVYKRHAGERDRFYEFRLPDVA